MRHLPALIALLAIVAASAAHAQDQEPVYGWTDDPARPADLNEWNPDIHEAPWFETWDFWMWADDGTFVMVQFLTSSFGFGVERNASGRLIVIAPDGYNVGEPGPGVAFGDRGWDWDDGDWSWEEEPLSITFRDCYIRGDGQQFEVYLRGRNRENFFEMTFDLDEELYRPGDGRLEYGWDRHRFYDQQVMPRFSFTGRVNRKESRDAEDNWHDLSGVGYAEHTLTNDFPFEVAASLQGFRALRDDGLSLVYDGVTVPVDHGGRTLGWFRVALDGAQVFESQEVAFVPTDVRSFEANGTTYQVPWGYEIQATNGEDWARVIVNNSEMISAESPFARIGSFLRAVLGAMMAPYDFELASDYHAWILVDGHMAHVSGRGWSTSNYTR